MKKEKNTYIPPVLTVVEFKTERGYAESATSLVMNSVQRINEFADQEMTIRMANESPLTGEAIGGEMYGNVDQTNPGGSSNWQYSNGGWF